MQRFAQQFDHWRNMFDVSTFVSKAIASAADFQFPVDVLASGQAIYDRSESLKAAIAKKQAGLLENSINPKRVRRLLVHHHSDFATVREILERDTGPSLGENKVGRLADQTSGQTTSTLEGFFSARHSKWCRVAQTTNKTRIRHPYMAEPNSLPRTDNKCR